LFRRKLNLPKRTQGYTENPAADFSFECEEEAETTPGIKNLMEDEVK
jgi:hypothetical protein